MMANSGDFGKSGSEEEAGRPQADTFGMSPLRRVVWEKAGILFTGFSAFHYHQS
jgi:hypothetical protein